VCWSSATTSRAFSRHSHRAPTRPVRDLTHRYAISGPGPVGGGRQRHPLGLTSRAVRWVRLATFSALIASACVGTAPTTPDAPAADRSYWVVAVLADGGIMSAPLRGVESGAPRRLGQVASPLGGHVAAVIGSNLFVVSGGRLTSFDLSADGPAPSWSIEIGAAPQRSASVSVGPRTGMLYVVGSDDAGVTLDLVDPRTRSRDARLLKARAGRDWAVYDAQVNEEERVLAVSYHGSDTTGVDLFPLSEPDRGCTNNRTNAGWGCLPGHGHATWWEREVIVATGTEKLLRASAVGALNREYDSTLTNDHLMEFALDPLRSEVVAIGSCGYRGGLATVDLRSGSTRLVAPASGSICGERIALTPEAIILTRAARPVAQADRPGSLSVLDRATAAPAQSVDLPVEAVDVVVVLR
jgi:hypothetical protein